MALINKIREKTGLAVGIIAFGLILFLVGGDLLGPSSVLLGNNQRNVGEIGGQNVSYERYSNEINEQTSDFTANFQRTPTTNEQFGLRNQAWTVLIRDILFEEQYKDLGIEVTSPEMIDMVQGKNVTPEIRQAFTDPATGQFDPERVRQYLQYVGQAGGIDLVNWQRFESRQLYPSRKRVKYENLLIKTSYVTSAEAQKQYEAENTNAEIRYLYVPYFSVSDSVISYTDQDLLNYMQEKDYQYQTERYRSAQIVAVPTVPSKADSLLTLEELESLRQGLATTANDSVYVQINSDAVAPFAKATPATLPDSLKANFASLTAGSFYGPYLNGSTYEIFKVSDVIEVDSITSARASHILIRSSEEDDPADRAEARKKANDLLRELRNGADFAELARENGEDGTASTGGDLGWFSTGTMVAEFQDAIFARNTTGVIPRVIETQFGFHLIDVTEVPTNKQFKVATIALEITASQTTLDDAYRAASRIAAKSNTAEELEANATAAGFAVETLDRVFPNDRALNNYTAAREAIRWLFTTASEGDISKDAFTTDNAYVVVRMTGEVDKGLAPLDDVRLDVTNQVANRRKADYVAGQLEALSGTLDEMAAAYGQGATVYTQADLKFSSSTITTVGFAPEAVGAAFGLEEGERTAVLKTDNGVVIIELMGLTPAGEIADYTTYQSQLRRSRQGIISGQIEEALKEGGDIEDERYKFF